MEEYISKIYMWKEITKEALPTFENINNANELWLWEVIKKNLETYETTYEEIQHTIVNALAILSGTICDGAKASCAAKIASSIDAGIMGYYMYKNKQQFYAGDGIVAHSVDETIQNIGTLGSQGMLQTNDKIIEMMISCD